MNVELLFVTSVLDVDSVDVSIQNNAHSTADSKPHTASLVAVVTDDGTITNQVAVGTVPEPVTKEKRSNAFGRREKSVLQTKLTRLAIQIGYTG